LAKRTIDWGLPQLQVFYADNKRELLGGGLADCEFWKRLLGSCNDLVCWRRTRFTSAVRHKENSTRVKFKVTDRDPRTRAGIHDAKFKEASMVLPGCSTFRSSAIHVYAARLLHESPATRDEVSAVVDALSDIVGDFEDFAGFKPPGRWGKLADGSKTSVAVERKKRAWKRTLKRKLASPRPKKGRIVVPDDDEEPDEEEVAEEIEEAAERIGAFWKKHRGSFVGKRMSTLFKEKEFFVSVTTRLCNIAQKSWTLSEELAELCVEFKDADNDSALEISVDDVTDKQRSHLLDQIRCVSWALSIVAMDSAIHWDEACALASAHFTAPFGAPPPAGRTISRWGVQFVQQGCRFKLNEQGYHKHPWIFEDNEDCKQDALKFLRKNIHGLSTDMFHKHLNSVLLPSWRDTCAFSAEETKMYSIEDTVCPKTAYLWMKRLGFTYSTITKHFYTDNHERPAVVAYRDEYIVRSRTRELKEPVWVSMPMATAVNNPSWSTLSKKNDPHCIHRYNASAPLVYVALPADADSVEFHVDLDGNFFRDMYLSEPEDEYKRFNGLRSVRYPEGRLVLHIGQDESVFKANAFSYRVWQETANKQLRPKGDGTGVMVSAFVSRAFGFNPEISQADLEAINAKRLNTHYADLDAAEALHGPGQTLKPPLTASPLLRKLKHGKSREGWWDYNHQVLQMEDVADVLHHLYPECDISMEVDNSSGHGKAKADGLNVMGLGVRWGGEQPRMRSSTITEGCLGPHNPLLKVGDVQHMDFQEDDNPPHFDAAAPKLDAATDRSKTRDLKVAELKKALKAAHNGLDLFDKMHLADLKKQAVLMKPPIALTVTELEVTPGYVGKQKGLKQILFERGWLDPNVIHKYYLNPKSEEEEDEPFCLKQLLGNCKDFMDEESQMVYVMRKINVTVEMSPKCHPELAGQGIEYCWGKAKKYYRAQRSAIPGSLSEDSFEQLVTKSLRGGPKDSDAPMQITSVLRFSRKAHFYRMAYYSLKGHEGTLKLAAIENSVKELKKATYKEHRGCKRKDAADENHGQMVEENE
jgi:hypothetical protein